MAALIIQLSPSAIKMKIKGESGSSCMMPLEGEKGLDGTPLNMMENREKEVRFTIQVTHEGSKPKARRVAFK